MFEVLAIKILIYLYICVLLRCETREDFFFHFFSSKIWISQKILLYLKCEIKIK